MSDVLRSYPPHSSRPCGTLKLLPGDLGPPGARRVNVAPKIGAPRPTAVLQFSRASILGQRRVEEFVVVAVGVFRILGAVIDLG